MPAGRTGPWALATALPRLPRSRLTATSTSSASTAAVVPLLPASAAIAAAAAGIRVWHTGRQRLTSAVRMRRDSHRTTLTTSTWRRHIKLRKTTVLYTRCTRARRRRRCLCRTPRPRAAAATARRARRHHHIRGFPRHTTTRLDAHARTHARTHRHIPLHSLYHTSPPAPSPLPFLREKKLRLSLLPSPCLHARTRFALCCLRSRSLAAPQRSDQRLRFREIF